MCSDLEVQWVDGTLHLSGEMDLATARRLDEAMAGWGPDRTELVLDLSRIDFMDSSACLAIVRVFESHARGTGMVLRNPSRAARKILALIPLEDAGIRIAAAPEATALAS